MNRSTVVPALIGIAVAVVIALVVGGVAFAVIAVQSAATSAGSNSRDDGTRDSTDDEADDDTNGDAETPSGDPRDGMTFGDGDTVLVGYFDFMCPFCGQFVTTNADQLIERVDAGELTVELRPISILDDASEGTQYSTRAAAAFACEAELNPDDSFEFFLALFGNQPAEFTEGLADSELANIADNIGGEPIDECIGDGTWLEWVGESTDEAIDGDGITATPTIYVNDVRYEGALDDAAQFADFLATAG